MSSSNYSKWILAFFLLALCACRASSPPAENAGSDAEQRVGEDPSCTLESWRATLAIGLDLRYDSPAIKQLSEVAEVTRCPEIRGLAEALLDDYGATLPTSLGTPAPVRVAGPDMNRKPADATVLRRKILLQLTVDADGRVKEMTQVEGFHNDWIDQLILEVAPTWLFRPARDDSGYVERTFDYSFFVGRP